MSTTVDLQKLIVFKEIFLYNKFNYALRIQYTKNAANAIDKKQNVRQKRLKKSSVFQD